MKLINYAMNIVHTIVKLIIDNPKLQLDTNDKKKLSIGIKKIVIGILINNPLKEKTTTKKNNTSSIKNTESINSIPLIKEPPNTLTSPSSPSSLSRTSPIDIPDYLECNNKEELNTMLNDIQLFEIMSMHGLESVNIKKTKIRNNVIDKLYSIICVIQEETNHSKSLRYLVEKEKFDKIQRRWKKGTLYYRNFELNSFLTESESFDKLYYIPSQDMFLICTLRKSGKLNIIEALLSYDGELEYLQTEKIKFKKLNEIYTDNVVILN